MKQCYEEPKLVEVGSFEALTEGNATGSHLDASFPAGTDKGDLTFSGVGSCFCG